MSVHDWSQWTEDNPDWLRDYSDPSTFPGFGEVGEWQDKLHKKNPSWNEVLKKAHKAGGISASLAQDKNIGTTQGSDYDD